MKLTPDPELVEQAYQALRDEYQINEQRPGMHQSELSYCLTKTFWNKTDFEPPTDHEAILFAIGFTAERVMLERDRPEPLEIDGITMSLDTLSLWGPADLKTTRMRAVSSGGCAICGEKKTGHTQTRTGHTYVVSEPTPFDFPDGWVKQAMSYRYALNREKIDRIEAACDCAVPNPPVHSPDCTCHGVAMEVGWDNRYDFRFVVIHLIEPSITGWLLHFTPEELEAHWNWLLKRKATLERMLERNDPAPFTTQQDWECGNCRYLLRCQLAGSMSKLQGIRSINT